MRWDKERSKWVCRWWLDMLLCFSEQFLHNILHLPHVLYIFTQNDLHSMFEYFDILLLLMQSKLYSECWMLGFYSALFYSFFKSVKHSRTSAVQSRDQQRALFAPILGQFPSSDPSTEIQAAHHCSCVFFIERSGDLYRACKTRSTNWASGKECT